MDPLSITASIIAVLQATNSVVSICYNYCYAAKGSSSEIPKTIKELTNFRNALEALDHLARQAESGDPVFECHLPTLKAFCGHDGPFEQCLVELESLEKKLLPRDWNSCPKSKRKTIVQALSWPLKESDTRKALERISRLQETIRLALVTDNVQSTLTIKRITNASHNIMLDTQRDIEKIITDGLGTKMRRWLLPPDPSLNHAGASKRRHPGTGTWLIKNQKFVDWKTNSKSLIWLNGIPGCGKTVLTSTIIEHILESCGNSLTACGQISRKVVFFYFDFNDPEKQKPENMIRSLIIQLYTQEPRTSHVLESLFLSKIDGEQQPTSNEILDIFKQMVQEVDELFIILDALDECVERDILLTYVEDMVGWTFDKLHILVTSRKENDIEDCLGSLTKNDGNVCIQSALVSEDIRAYVNQKLHNDRAFRRWQGKPEVQGEIERVLVAKSDGMFRWTVCQLDTLKTCLNLSSLRNALASLPRTLDETHARMLNNIAEEHTEDAYKLLQWLAYSTRPLRIEEVSEVVAIDINSSPSLDYDRRFPDPGDIMSICHGLITTTTDKLPRDGPSPVYVRLAHYSVKEYLLSSRILTGSSRGYHIRDIGAHEFISQSCLAYLLHFEIPLTAEIVQNHPLASYAAQFWPHHAKCAGETSSNQRSIHMLFSSNRQAYCNWIRLYKPDEPLFLGIDLTRDGDTIPSPLYFASLTGLKISAFLLLEGGADVNKQGGKYGTALQAAAVTGDTHMVELLLSKGVDVNAQGGFYGNAFQAAVSSSHSQIAEILLQKGADIDRLGGRFGNPLQCASWDGNATMVEFLLKNKANVDSKGGKYGNALHIAVNRGHTSVAELLLTMGANIETPGGFCGNALRAAAWRGNFSMVKLLLMRNVRVDVQGRLFDDLPPLGILETDFEVMQKLDDDASQDKKWWGAFGDMLGENPQYTSLSEYLLANGPEINALQVAVRRGHVDIVELLIANGADANNQGGPHGNALQVAARRRQVKVAQTLLANGAMVNTQGGLHGNALQAAAWTGSTAMIELLLKNGAEINQQGGLYGNSLQAAVSEGHIEAVKLLLTKGAMVNAVGGRYGSALQAANCTGNNPIAELLISSGAIVLGLK